MEKQMASNSLENGAVILIAPDQDLGDAPQGLDEQMLVLLADALVLGQHIVQGSRRGGKKGIEIVELELLSIVLHSISFDRFRLPRAISIGESKITSDSPESALVWTI